MRASPSCHFHSATDQSSFLSSPNKIKWVKEREALHICLYLLLTCHSLDTLSVSTVSDHFHHFCPSMLWEASHHLVFTLHVLNHLHPHHLPLLCQTSTTFTAITACLQADKNCYVGEITLILTWIQKLGLKLLENNQSLKQQHSLLPNLVLQSQDGKRNFWQVWCID